MKIPKKLIVGIGVRIANNFIPVIINSVSEKQKRKLEKLEKEKIYANQKHNGIVKYTSILFSLISIILTLLSMKQTKILLSIIGILAILSYIITFLYCLEIINEKKHNIYKIFFIIGNMLMVTVATLLCF